MVTSLPLYRLFFQFRADLMPQRQFTRVVETQKRPEYVQSFVLNP